MAERQTNAWERIDAYVERACVEEGVPDWPNALAARPPGYLRAASMWWTDVEVMNGGFQQYFLNSTNEVVWFAIAGYQRLGETRMADLIRSAAFVCLREHPALLRAPVPTTAFVDFEPMAQRFDDLNELYDEVRVRLPVADGIENGCYLHGAVEHYWHTYPEDFRPAPE